MNVGRLVPRWLGLLLAGIVTVVALVIIVGAVDVQLLADAGRRAADEPVGVAAALGAFGLAFVLRAAAWRRVLPGLPFGHALAGIHLALGANHVLPLRLGEPLRVLSVTRRTGLAVEPVTASTVTLRAVDMLTVVAVGGLMALSPLGEFAVFTDLVGWVGLALAAALGVVAAVGHRWLRALVDRSRTAVRALGPGAVLLSAGAWLLESVLVWQTARWAGLEVAWADAVLVTTIAVAAQVVAVAPGGFGTYEAAAVAAWLALGHEVETALVAALAAHGLKTAYSLVVGAVALFRPGPGLFGRLRLVVAEPVATGRREPAGDGPIVLFMPAHNEEASVGDCVRRVPGAVLGRRVEVLVVDDGSTDETARLAAEAGAEVLSHSPNRGLGAAVRVGLAAGVERGAAAIAFCDADGEYPPEELAALVAPILDGEADYVAGSRFLGRIEHMHPHRRVGNIVLTWLLSIVARRRITDGQTGYRAFSPAAASAAEIIHDFNYAQVVTLDLLAKGYRYHEVPISYHFRTQGRSFIRLGRYLRNVVPAVYRELNAG